MSDVCSLDELNQGKCVPCEGGVPRFSREEAVSHLEALEGWTLLGQPDRIAKTWTVKNFVAGMEFFQRITELAEAETHHPDLHMGGYRNVTIEIRTHAIDGLSLNDFILAAKIDELPVRLKKQRR